MIRNSFLLVVFTFLRISQYECLNDTKDETTLTSATVLESTSPVPTTVFRRIHVNQGHDTDDISTLVYSVDARRNKNSNFIWKWDEWCQYQPQKGHCSENITRYYYNTAVEKCLNFQYSGCDANKNNFETVLDCERFCKGTGFLLEDGHVRPSLCYYQPDAGMCLAFIKRYFYDINEKMCKKFVYGGCGGNYNRFDTLLGCMNACQISDFYN